MVNADAGGPEWPEVDRILTEAERLYRAVERSALDHGAHPGSGERTEAQWDLDRFRRTCAARLGDETAPLVRDALHIVQLCGVNDDGMHSVDRALLRGQVSPLSPVWPEALRVVHPGLLHALASDDTDGDAYLERVRVENPSDEIRIILTEEAFYLAIDDRNSARWTAMLNDLEALDLDPSDLAHLRELVERVEKLRPGQPAPTFEVAALDPGDADHTLDAYLGRHVLLHFWSTWCLPCRDDMQLLQQMIELYGHDRLAILSLSEDDSPQAVREFRAEPGHAMPWDHAFIGASLPGGVADRYAVFSLPRLALVGPDGRLVVEETALLRGDRLPQTLTEHLGEP